ncbi:hypothetical protein [Acinetobacter halotolerans]|nr:hypothetical protein [Acinetobacter halotolerans]
MNKGWNARAAYNTSDLSFVFNVMAGWLNCSAQGLLYCMIY